jgi:uncharacterized alpha-E superfamily protein/hemerythrin-like domain-containing protein
MLLSSVAEAMFWSGRYIERGQGLARAIQAVERLSLDLPGRHALGLRPLLPLVQREASGGDEQEPSQVVMLQALALNAADASSVLGALSAARENLRQARVDAPPELWGALNDQYLLLKGVADQPMPQVLAALSSVLEAGSRIHGVLDSHMARDAAYSFLNLGIELERADVSLRVLGALLPVLSVHGWERTFDDVRWAGLLSALGVLSMYRRSHHHQTELPVLLDFLLVDMTSPRSVAHCLRLIEDELGNLPRASLARAKVGIATSKSFALSHATEQEVAERIDEVLGALAAVHGALESSYFPALSLATPPSIAGQSTDLVDPFAYLGREHAQVEAVLQVLDELAEQADRFERVEPSELNTILSFLTEFGELGHHEKEELILTPKLIENGFDWFEGPVAAMRREHRHEHFFSRVLMQLANQRAAWSAEDRRRFITDAHEFAHFLRAHMDHERRDLFEQAARRLSAQTKKLLTQAFVEFDAKQQSLAGLSAKVDALLRKYGCTVLAN